jgi:hypothetical protein
MLTAGALAGLEVAGRAARDGFFLSELPTTSLPLAMAAAALLSVAGTFGLSAWLQRGTPERVAPLALGISAVLFALLSAASRTAPRASSAALYLHMTGLVPVVVTAFWSLVNERFDPYTAKKVVARMAAAGALGGVVGGVAAERVTFLVGMPSLLLTLSALSGLCALGTRRLVTPPAGSRTQATRSDAGTGVQAVTRRPLLRQMALLMGLVAIVETLVDYALKVEAAGAFQGADALVRFFAAFYIGCGLLSFGIQIAVGQRFLRRFGLASAVAMLPASVALTGAVGALTSRLWAFVLTRGAETVASLAFFRSGFQLLYTPLPPAVGRPSKAWIDVAAGSAGDVLGAAIVFGALASWPGLPSRVWLALASAGSLLALLLVLRIHRSYVDQLGESLRAGRLSLRNGEAIDATTVQTIARTQLTLDRETLLGQARAHAVQQAAASSAPERAPVSEPVATGADPVAGWIEALGSPDPKAARRVLQLDVVTAPEATERRRRQLVAHAIPLLGVDATAADAQRFLRDRGARISGQLVDALLDPDETLAVRVRVAALLGEFKDPRAMAGLWQALSDDVFELRFACGRAAVRSARRAASLAPTAADVYARVGRELEVADAQWSRQGHRVRGDTDRSALLAGPALRQVSRSVEHVFTLLCLTHERDLMASSLLGLTGNGAALRGTALEYLESVLPAALCRRLFKRLEAGVAPPHQRTKQEMERQLLMSAMDVLADPDA